MLCDWPAEPPAVCAVPHSLDKEYEDRAGVYIHRSARVEDGAILKAPALIHEGCFIAAHAYLHWNERTDKSIHVRINGQRIGTGLTRFGALLGDGVRIGANAVLSPGTLLEPGAMVGRLQLVEQDGVELWSKSAPRE